MDSARSFVSRNEWRIDVTSEMMHAIFSNEPNVVGIMSLLLLHSWNFNLNLSSPNYTGMYNFFTSILADIARDGITSSRRKDLYHLLSLSYGDHLTSHMFQQEDGYKSWILKFPRNYNARRPEPKYDNQSEAEFFKECALFTMASVSGNVWHFTPKIRSSEHFLKQFDSCGISITIALHLAVRCRSFSNVERLLASGVKIVIGQLPNPLAWAVLHYQHSSLAIFKAHRGNIVGCDGRLPLHCAAEFESIPVVRFLLEEGADPNVIDKDGRTALQVARDNKRPGVVGLLEAANDGRLNGFDQEAAERADVEKVMDIIFLYRLKLNW